MRLFLALLLLSAAAASASEERLIGWKGEVARHGGDRHAGLLRGKSSESRGRSAAKGPDGVKPWVELLSWAPRRASVGHSLHASTCPDF